MNSAKPTQDVAGGDVFGAESHSRGAECARHAQSRETLYPSIVSFTIAAYRTMINEIVHSLTH